jgi:hypothetical protein
VLAAAAVCVLSLIRGQPLVFLSDLTLLAAWWRLLSGSWSRPMPQISIPLVALAFGFWLTGVMT